MSEQFDHGRCHDPKSAFNDFCEVVAIVTVVFGFFAMGVWLF